MKIRLSKPFIGKEEIDAVVAVLQSDTLSLGPKLEEFEKMFASYVGTKHAIAVNSGTSGLHLVIKALGIKEGDEVITTPFSFIASANCSLFEGARPVFVDIDKDTYNIDPNKIEAAITSKTRAILPVHVFGQTCDMDPIIAIAKKHNLKIIEDSCEAIGAKYKNENAGTFGDAAVFAFYPNKQMTTGEGGMVITNSDEIATLCRSYRNQGRDSMAWLGHTRIGYNYRLSDINCAIGVEQLKKIDTILNMRKNVATKYLEKLRGNKDLILPHVPDYNEESWFVFVVQVQDGINRDGVIKSLKEKGVSANIYFPPIHLQKFYRDDFGFKEGDFPETEAISKRTIALPFFSELTDEEIDYVCESLEQSIDQNKQ